MAMTIDMTDRQVLISGASSGIGRAMAVVFARAGARLQLLDVDEAGLARTCDTLEASGCAGVQQSVLDLGSKAQVDAFWDSLERTPDTLVNNAGIYPMCRFMELDEPAIEQVMAVNLESLYWMCQGFIRARGKLGGVIINVSSIEAYTAFKPEMVAYVTSKTAVLGFTRALAREFGHRRFRINALVPGGIRTPGTESVARRLITRGEVRLIKTGWDFMQRLPLGRMGRPEEVAHVALFLASDLASYVHGTAIAVDGGFLSA